MLLVSFCFSVCPACFKKVVGCAWCATSKVLAHLKPLCCAFKTLTGNKSLDELVNNNPYVNFKEILKFFAFAIALLWIIVKLVIVEEPESEENAEDEK